jgi:hypothetical protein
MGDPIRCQHETFAAAVNVVRLSDVGKFVAEVTVHCAQCYTPFRFLGLPHGLRNASPTVGVGDTEARLPIAPGEANEIPSRITFEVPQKGPVQ